MCSRGHAHHEHRHADSQGLDHCIADMAPDMAPGGGGGRKIVVINFLIHDNIRSPFYCFSKMQCIVAAGSLVPYIIHAAGSLMPPDDPYMTCHLMSHT